MIEVSSHTQNGIAYWAHIGGLISGAVLFAVMRPAGVKLFDCVHSEPTIVAGHFDPL